MPDHIDRILATGRVELLVGDVREKHLGLDPGVLNELAESVTLVIHCAANISLLASLNDTIRDNCLPTLELAKLASGFKNLSRFVYVSTAYVNIFLPAGSVEEKIYETRDAEKQLAEILETGSASASDVEDFPTPYTFAKHLTERLLFLRHPRLALLIFRPTFIGPAISQPFPYYQRDGSVPASTLIEKFMEFGISKQILSHLHGATNILDEIPVDLAANLLLLHCMHGSTGPVHACAQSYIPRTFSQFIADDVAPYTRQVNTRTQSSGRAGTRLRFALRFYPMMSSGKDWHFSNAASRKFANVGGPLGMKLHDHDPEKFFAYRSKVIAEKVRAKAAAKLGANGAPSQKERAKTWARIDDLAYGTLPQVPCAPPASPAPGTKPATSIALLGVTNVGDMSHVFRRYAYPLIKLIDLIGASRKAPDGVLFATRALFGHFDLSVIGLEAKQSSAIPFKLESVKPKLNL
ncbi:Fatty acyl-CoA reductase [Mycena venus]|uniref:Fatty acyl-CoA reductase n=1 Tax=Mycena venus TaxID=2733690 RepID=A0A8H7CZU3_9AGAR|nr:Fatty acyl-CoA reductase [Mycena venus]